MGNSKVKLPKATDCNSGIDYRIANPDDVPSGNTITAQPLAPLSRICNSARNIRQFAIACGEIAIVVETRCDCCRDAMHRVSTACIKCAQYKQISINKNVI
jgi:hypothetical protein